ncbi:hypothetical protein [Streptomyces sp. NPDC050485]|uniref:hypothetical protein n=1 Tax=Streptomyces sp. NPDC050485 TaxID=3365617 RepID=UPI0037B7118B
MTPELAYAAARQMIDPDADYLVHVRTTTGWAPPGDPGQRELPGLDVLLTVRRVLRAQPAGSVSSTHPQTLNLRTGDGRIELRFVPNALVADLCGGPGCGEFLPSSSPCPRCSTAPVRPSRAPEGLWRVLGLPDSAIVPVTRADLTLTDLAVLARACHTLYYARFARPVLPPEAARLLHFLSGVLDDIDEGQPDALDIHEALSRSQLLTLAEAGLTLYRNHGDPDDFLGRPSVLLLAHLAYDDPTG